jgi:flagellar biosynthetic protein FliO
LAKISTGKRRQIITVAIILGAAFLGLVLVTGQQSGERQSVYAGLYSSSSTPAPTDTAAAKPDFQETVGKSVAAFSIFKMLMALAVVIVCIYAGIYLLKRMTSRKHTSPGGTNLLEVLETAYIDPKKSLSLVRVADKSVLIGVTDNQISVLTELDQEHTQSLLASVAQHARSDGFGNILKAASNSLKGFGFRKDPQQ